MTRKQYVSMAALAAVTGLGASIASASVTIPTAPIGNAGNAPDPSTGFGAVSYTYNIGRTEVTNAQYTAFLNAVAADDTFGLYNTEMAGSLGGITRLGSPGSFTYSTISGRENHPVNWVSFWDATRFANWLHNGQPAGAQNSSTTEGGAYTLTPGGVAANTVVRNADWRWAVAGEDEWYKAAYFQPVSQGGDSDDYWLWPTSSNSTPTTAQANFDNVIGGPTDVGSYAPNLAGTFDMGGNVSEWNDAIITSPSRGVRGGSFFNSAFALRALNAANVTATIETSSIGFRVVQIPTPSVVTLLAIGGLVAARRRR